MKRKICENENETRRIKILNNIIMNEEDDDDDSTKEFLRKGPWQEELSSIYSSQAFEEQP